jgi:hypothetical protein
LNLEAFLNQLAFEVMKNEVNTVDKVEFKNKPDSEEKTLVKKIVSLPS